MAAQVRGKREGTNLTAARGDGKLGWRAKAKEREEEAALQAAAEALAVHWAVQSPEPELMAALQPVMPRITLALLQGAFTVSTVGDASRITLAKITGVPWGRAGTANTPAKEKAAAKAQLMDLLTTRLSEREAAGKAAGQVAAAAPGHGNGTAPKVIAGKLPF